MLQALTFLMIVGQFLGRVPSLGWASVTNVDGP